MGNNSADYAEICDKLAHSMDRDARTSQRKQDTCRRLEADLAEGDAAGSRRSAASQLIPPVASNQTEVDPEARLGQIHAITVNRSSDDRLHETG